MFGRAGLGLATAISTFFLGSAFAEWRNGRRASLGTIWHSGRMVGIAASDMGILLRLCASLASDMAMAGTDCFNSGDDRGICDAL
ncbi:hypothetical protein A6R74_16590 [Halomonas sp. ALS9]|nr:hypothetical protein A6R74_16590 [Halomonas sp. ALS9]